MRALSPVRFRVGCLLVIGFLALFPGRASAELSDEQQTWWGVSGDLGSRTVGDFSSLTWAVESMGGTVFYGGRFAEVTNGAQSYDRPYLAAFDAGTGVPIPWFDPQPEGAVLALEPSPDGGLFVGGEMGSWGGTQIGALHKIDPNTGATWPGWKGRVYGGTSVVRDISMGNDGWLYIGGTFTTASEGNGPIAVSNVIRIDPETGDVDENWLPTVEGGAVWGVSASQTTNRVYIGGWFTSVNGDTAAQGFASLRSGDAATMAGRTFSTNARVGQIKIYDVLATTEGTVFAAGEEHALWVLDEQTLEQTRQHFTNCTAYSDADGGCGTRSGGEFQEVVQIGNRVYATCHCWQDHVTATTGTIVFRTDYTLFPYTGEISTIAAYEPASGDRIRSFEPYMAGDVGGFSIAGASDGCIWIAGGINTVGQPGNTRTARDVVRICDEAGPGPDPQPNSTPPAPQSCNVVETNGSATISWPNTGADNVVIESSTDGVTWQWRGSADAPASAYTDTPSPGAVTSYSIRNQWGAPSSELKRCWPNVDLRPDPAPATAPATCAATNIGIDATISWTASPNATSYRVHRTVDGSSEFWRASTTQTSLDDPLRTAGVHIYLVAAQGTDGSWSTQTTCSPELIAIPAGGGGGTAAAPAACTATNNGVDATISWDSANNAIEYRVHRSIDGGTWFWRSRTSSTTLDDTLRTSGLHSYGVQAKGVDGIWSERTVCTPQLNPADGEGLAAAPPASCDASVSGTDAVISWAVSANAVEYRIYRSIDGSRDYWRGKTVATVTTDPLRTSGVHTYSVQAKGVNGQWSTSAICAPQLTP